MYSGGAGGSRSVYLGRGLRRYVAADLEEKAENGRAKPGAQAADTRSHALHHTLWVRVGDACNITQKGDGGWG